MDAAGLNLEAERRADHMKTLNSGSPRIDHQHVTLGIPNHHQDMGMAADEDVRPISVEEFTGTRVISAGISADVDQKDLHTLTVEETVERMSVAQVIVVAVAGHAHQRLKGSYFLGQTHASAEVTRMPDFVHGREEVTDAVVENAVRVGYETNIHILQLYENPLFIKIYRHKEMRDEVQNREEEGNIFICSEDGFIIPAYISPVYLHQETRHDE